METADVISLGSLSLALFMGFFTLRRNTKKDDQDEASLMVSFKADLKYMTKQIESIETKLSRIEDKVDDTNSRISRNEERTASALKQIDLLRKKVDRLEDARTNKTS